MNTLLDPCGPSDFFFFDIYIRMIPRSFQNYTGQKIVVFHELTDAAGHEILERARALCGKNERSFG